MCACCNAILLQGRTRKIRIGVLSLQILKDKPDRSGCGGNQETGIFTTTMVGVNASLVSGSKSHRPNGGSPLLPAVRVSFLLAVCL